MPMAYGGAWGLGGLQASAVREKYGSKPTRKGIAHDNALRQLDLNGCPSCHPASSPAPTLAMPPHASHPMRCR